MYNIDVAAIVQRLPEDMVGEIRGYIEPEIKFSTFMWTPRCMLRIFDLIVSNISVCRYLIHTLKQVNVKDMSCHLVGEMTIIKNKSLQDWFSIQPAKRAKNSIFQMIVVGFYWNDDDTDYWDISNFLSDHIDFFQEWYRFVYNGSHKHQKTLSDVNKFFERIEEVYTYFYDKKWNHDLIESQTKSRDQSELWSQSVDESAGGSEKGAPNRIVTYRNLDNSKRESVILKRELTTYCSPFIHSSNFMSSTYDHYNVYDHNDCKKFIDTTIEYEISGNLTENQRRWSTFQKFWTRLYRSAQENR